MKLSIFLSVAFLISPAFATTCIPPRPTTPERCLNPPVVSRLDIPSYMGKWFNIYASGIALNFTEECATANYTLNSDNTVKVLNCRSRKSDTRPRCIRGVATPREGLPASRLVVSFPRAPSGSYEVVALLGRKNYGYFAAAVYTCALVNGVPLDGIFIITRAPFARRFVLGKLVEKLRCRGFLVGGLSDIRQDRMCEYFDGGEGFDVFALGV